MTTPQPVVLAVNALRGGLIGAAEVVPGVSGGTVALVVGLYERLIGSAGHLLSALRLLVGAPRGQRTREARQELRQVDWWTVVPVLVSMAIAVVALASVIEPLLEEHPERSRALFFGLVLASIAVPAAMVGRWGRREGLLAAAAAVAAYALTSLPPASAGEPPLPAVFAAAALAICALVLPGVSGSFLLLSLGMYESTLAAVNDRNLGYLVVFALGALTGLALFVKLLQYLLEHRRKVTLALMTGLMAGSLRALWPWQEEDRSLLAPTGDLAGVVALALLGVAVVGVLLLVEARHAHVGPVEAARLVGEDPLDDPDHRPEDAPSDTRS